MNDMELTKEQKQFIELSKHELEETICEIMDLSPVEYEIMYNLLIEKLD